MEKRCGCCGHVHVNRRTLDSDRYRQVGGFVDDVFIYARDELESVNKWEIGLTPADVMRCERIEERRKGGPRIGDTPIRYKVDKETIRALQGNGRDIKAYYGPCLSRLGQYWIHGLRVYDGRSVIHEIKDGKYSIGVVQMVVDNWVKEIRVEAVMGVMEWAEKRKIPPGLEREILGYM